MPVSRKVPEQEIKLKRFGKRLCEIEYFCKKLHHKSSNLMSRMTRILLFFAALLLTTPPVLVYGQLVINEGSNRNYTTIADENGDYPDWIELLNVGSDTINLLNYSLTDTPANPSKWQFPAIKLPPGEFLTVFCSGKDRKPVSGFVAVSTSYDFTPVTGWNTHHFANPFYWDGVSNLLINTCSYNSTQYTSNSSFRQSATSFFSTLMHFIDGSDASCSTAYGTRVKQRPNMRLNGLQIGNGQIQNPQTEYPAPYGNWYWKARHQMLIQSSELTQAGLTEGWINNLAFDVAATDPNTWYDYFDIQLRLVSTDELPSAFETLNPSCFQHTNFKLAKDGESVLLFSPEMVFLSSLYIDSKEPDVSNGRYPDASASTSFLWPASPSVSNTGSQTYGEFLAAPTFSTPSGFYNAFVGVYINNPNQLPSTIHFTTDGNDPTTSSPAYNGEAILLTQTTVLKAKAFSAEALPGKTAVSTYFFNVDHQSPIMSVVTNFNNLYGPQGIFDNWWQDWEKAAYVEYFDSCKNQVFSQRAGMQIDGGWGGARNHPQHSFRIELDDGVLGDGPVFYPFIPTKPERTKFSKFYLRNGSNQYLILPYKEACQTAMMAGETKNYYSGWDAVSVYINGTYFGLYDLREKLDAEYFQVWDGADDDNIDILSQSAWYGGVLRAVEGSVDAFNNDYEAFLQINPATANFWNHANQYFDLEWYTDYIIGESWMGNTDWPWNNIKIVRSDKTNFSWRFCLMDMELAMLPNAWSDCNYNHIEYMLNYDQSNKFIHIWQRGLQNSRFRNYFINRFADLMNTAFLPEKLIATENEMFTKMNAEMPNEFARWGDPNNISGQMAEFENNHNIFQQQLLARTAQVRNHIQNNFNLPAQVNVSLNVVPEGAGFVRISTLIPDNYPWQGVYFDGVPVHIEAIGSGPYHFLHWNSNSLISDTLNPVFYGLLNAGNVTFEAVFGNTTGLDPAKATPHLTVFPNPANEMLEIGLQNSSNSKITYCILNLQGKIFQNGEFETLNTTERISIKNLPKGMYLLEIVTADQTTANTKFVKQ